MLLLLQGLMCRHGAGAAKSELGLRPTTSFIHIKHTEVFICSIILCACYKIIVRAYL